MKMASIDKSKIQIHRKQDKDLLRFLSHYYDLVHTDGTQDRREHYRFLQATGCLCKHEGNMRRLWLRQELHTVCI